MTTERKPSRRYASESEIKRTNAVETAVILTQLTDRARRTGAAQGPLVPVEALMTIESDAWGWQTGDRKVLEKLSHRLVVQTERDRLPAVVAQRASQFGALFRGREADHAGIRD